MPSIDLEVLTGAASAVLTVTTANEPPVAFRRTRSGDRTHIDEQRDSWARRLGVRMNPEGAILSYRWTDDHGVTYTGATPSVTILGTVTIAHFTLVVNDGIQDSPPSTVTVRLET